MWRQTHVLCGRTTFRAQLNYVHNYYGPYAHCSLDKGVAYTGGRGCNSVSFPQHHSRFGHRQWVGVPLEMKTQSNKGHGRKDAQAMQGCMGY